MTDEAKPTREWLSCDEMHHLMAARFILDDAAGERFDDDCRRCGHVLVLHSRSRGCAACSVTVRFSVALFNDRMAAAPQLGDSFKLSDGTERVIASTGRPGEWSDR